MDDDDKPPKVIPDLKNIYTALSEEQLKDLKAAMDAAKKGFKYDHKTKQYDFRFKDGGEVCRGQGRVRKQKKFRIT